MTAHTELEKKQQDRLKELFGLSRQRYLDAGGDPKKRPSGFKGDDYLTDEERKEILAIARHGVKIIDGYVHCQGRSWKLPENSRLLKNQTTTEVKSDG